MEIINEILKTSHVNSEEIVTGGWACSSIEFLKEMGKIVPLKTEFLYAYLEQLVATYYFKVRELETLGRTINGISYNSEYISDRLTELNVEIAEKKIELERLQKELETLTKDRKYDEIPAKAVECSRVASSISSLERQKETNEEFYQNKTDISIDKQVEASKVAEEIKEIIELIKSVKQDIKEISGEGKDKIDDIAIHRKHIDALMKIVEDFPKENGLRTSSEEDKQNIKKSQYTLVLFIINYVKMIKEHYKNAEKLSDDIIKAYDERRVLHREDSEDSEMFFGTRDIIFSENSSDLADAMIRNATFPMEMQRAQLMGMSDSFADVTELLRDDKYKSLTPEQLDDMIQTKDQENRRSNYSSRAVGYLVTLLRNLQYVKNKELSAEEPHKKIA